MKSGPYLIIGVMLLAICGGCKLPSERAVYRRSLEAVQADPDLPSAAVLDPKGKAVIRMAKNAASVELPYEYVGSTGEILSDSYTIWFKRIGRRWAVERYYRTPRHQR